MDELFFRSYYAAYNSEDEAILKTFLAEDVVAVSAFGETRGKDEYLATVRSMTSIFKDQLFPEKITIAGDTAIIEVLDKLEAKIDISDFMGRAYAKGSQLQFRIHATYVVANEKIKHITIKMID